METFSSDAVRQFLDRAGIGVADPQRGIGRELTYFGSPRRTVVVHFAETDSREYVSRVVSVLLSEHDRWLLVPRYGSASMLGFPSVPPGADALVFHAAQLDDLCAYLCTRDMRLGSASCDLYVVSGSGRVLITWDHHTSDEGLQIDLCDVDESSSLLTRLNAIGTELELFYRDNDQVERPPVPPGETKP